MQSETEQRAHKISFYVDKGVAQEVMKSLSECLEKRGVRGAIFVSLWLLVFLWFTTPYC